MSIAQTFEVKKLVLNGGRCPFDEWFDSLSEDDQVMVDDRLARVRNGSFGEINTVGGGISELKFRKGRAVRIYYGRVGKQVLLLIAGGDKATQKRDIKRAAQLFRLVQEGTASYENR